MTSNLQGLRKFHCCPAGRAVLTRVGFTGVGVGAGAAGAGAALPVENEAGEVPEISIISLMIAVRSGSPGAKDCNTVARELRRRWSSCISSVMLKRTFCLTLVRVK